MADDEPKSDDEAMKIIERRIPYQSTEDLKKMAVEGVERIQESLFGKPLYIRFVESDQTCRIEIIDGLRSSKPLRPIFGPYVNVQIREGAIHVQECLGAGDQSFVLAHQVGDLWRIQDGMDLASPLYSQMLINTLPPMPSDDQAR